MNFQKTYNAVEEIVKLEAELKALKNSLVPVEDGMNVVDVLTNHNLTKSIYGIREKLRVQARILDDNLPSNIAVNIPPFGQIKSINWLRYEWV